MAHSLSMGLLGATVTSPLVPRLFDGVQTHDAARDLIATLVGYPHQKHILRSVIQACLPGNYNGNTLDEFELLYDGAIHKGFDQSRRKAGDRARQPLDIVRRSCSLHHDKQGNGVLRIILENGGTRCVKIGSQACRSWIRRLCLVEAGRAPRKADLSDIEETLQALSEIEGTFVDTSLRVGGEAGAIYLDLGDLSWTAVIINPSGWRISATSPAYFLRSAGQQALPEPKHGGNILRLKELLGLDEPNWHKILGFLLNALRYGGPYMCLLIEGEQGSGKSILAQIIKTIIDPNALVKQKLVDNERDLMIIAQMHYLPVFDNVSGMRGDISDALCTLSTGGGFATRRLYTDDEQQVFNFCRPFVINGIADFASRPDLLERAIVVRLPEMEANSRREESDILRAFFDMLPEITGCLYSAAAMALANEHCGKPSVRLRMADAARWITAGEAAFGLKPGTIVRTIAESQTEVMNERAHNDAVVSALANLLVAGPIEDTVGTIFEALVVERPRFDRSFPPTAAHFSRHLKRLRPAMAKIGMHVEFLPHRREGTRMRIWKAGRESERFRTVERKY